MCIRDRYIIFMPPYGLKFGLSAILMNINWVTFVGLTVFALNFFWIYKGIEYFREEKVSGLEVLIYVIAYSYLVTIYWMAALAKEVAGEKMSW